MAKVRITFRSEVYIEGEDMAEVKANWENLPLFSADALEYAYPEVLDVQTVEDAETYQDLKNEFDAAEYDNE